MINFEQQYDREQPRPVVGSQDKPQEQAEAKRRNFSSRAFVLGLVIIIVAGVAYRFWPKVEGLWQTARATMVSNKDVSLTGILYAKENPSAIVNGKVVREGDVVGGVIVLKIGKDMVEFERSGTQWSQGVITSEKGAGSGLPTLLQIGSPTCPPCKRMTPILDELRTKYAKKFQVRYIDLGKNKSAGMKYGLRAIPTQIFYDTKGREVFRHVGFYSEKDILTTWKTLGVKP
ncbi:MAG: thioredoxin domain-containing protein [Planctomycetota bacterium]|jgi:thioredoxin 1